jgi:hypothetical protein
MMTNYIIPFIAGVLLLATQVLRKEGFREKYNIKLSDSYLNKALGLGISIILLSVVLIIATKSPILNLLV